MSAITAPATAAQNTELYLGNDVSPSVFSTYIARVGDIAIGGLSVMMQDVSNQASTWKRMLGTLHEGGAVTFTLYFSPSTGADQGLLAVFATAPPPIRAYKLLWPDGAPWLFNGTISKWASKAPVEGVITADIEITIDGQVVFGVGGL